MYPMDHRFQIPIPILPKAAWDHYLRLAADCMKSRPEGSVDRRPSWSYVSLEQLEEVLNDTELEDFLQFMSGALDAELSHRVAAYYKRKATLRDNIKHTIQYVKLVHFMETLPSGGITGSFQWGYDDWPGILRQNLIDFCEGQGNPVSTSQWSKANALKP